MNIAEQARDAVAGMDNERSRQSDLGWSEVGGCRATLYYRLSGVAATNITDGWRARVGTELHAALLPTVARALGGRYEIETTYGGIRGHSDLVCPSLIGDLKTPALRRSRLYQHDPSLLYGYRLQIQGYAAGLVKAAEVDPDGLKCAIIFAPVDGTYADWWADVQPYDRDVADAGVERVAKIQELVDAGTPPPCSKGFEFCGTYSPYADLEWPDGDTDGDQITDPDSVAAVTEYGELSAQIRKLTKERDEYKPMLAGLSGVAGDWKISQSRGRDSLDQAEVRSMLELMGLDVPMVHGAPFARVSRARK